jgi:hypothetical protein
MDRHKVRRPMDANLDCRSCGEMWCCMRHDAPGAVVTVTQGNTRTVFCGWSCFHRWYTGEAE